MQPKTAANLLLVHGKIRSFIRRTIKSKFVRNVAIVTSGTVGAQAIIMAFSPVITRLYGPEAFGLLGVFMSIVAVITPLAALSFPVAIVLPKTDNDAKGIARLSVYLALGIAGFLFLALLAVGHWLMETLRIQEIGSLILLIPPTMLFVAFMQITHQWLIRKKQFAITARVAVIQALIVNSAKTGIGLIKPVAAMLIILSTLGNAIHALMLAIGAKKAEVQNQHKKKSHSLASLWVLAKRYYDFPFYRSPQAFINAISQSFPVLMLAAFFGPTSAGFYTICKRVIDMPSRTIGKSVGDVFYPRIAESANNGENLTWLILKATLSLVAVGLVPFSIVIVFGPLLFGFVFGAEWVVAGEYARWLALWLFFGFINRPSVVSIPVLRLQGFLLIYEIIGVTLRVTTLFIGMYLLNDDILAIMLFSLAGVVWNAGLIIFTILNSHFSKKIGNNRPS